MKIFKTDGTIDENAAGECAYTADNPAVKPAWQSCHDSIKANWRAIGATVAARVRQELEEICDARESSAINQFAAGIFKECHPDCQTTFFASDVVAADFCNSLLNAVQAMRREIDSQKQYIQKQGNKLKDCRADEIETLRQSNRSLEDELANTRGAFSRASKRCNELEKTSALWCDRFIEVTKANSEIGMALVEMMVRHGVEPPANEQAAVAARETRQSKKTPAGYSHLSCLACKGTGWNGGDMKGDEPDCPQCNGTGSVMARSK